MVEDRQTKDPPHPLNDGPHYQVTAALIRGPDGTCLIARRPPGGLHGGLWEFPGGKQEPGESLAQCVVREIREELGLEIAAGDRLVAVEQEYRGFRITLHLMDCRLAGSGEPPAESDSLLWVQPGELDHYEMPEADRKAIRTLAIDRG